MGLLTVNPLGITRHFVPRDPYWGDLQCIVNPCLRITAQPGYLFARSLMKASFQRPK